MKMPCCLPHEESPFESPVAATDTGVTLGEGDATGALEVNVGDGLVLFVAERESGCTTGCTGDCTANWPNPFTGGKYSGRGSFLKTSSKRARLKLAKSVKPRYAGVVSRSVIRLDLAELCLKCSRFSRYPAS
jgi:predicted lipoprotein with Yx(FWY)xxD motif